MRKFTLIGLNRQTYDFARPQAEQFETFDVIATTEKEALRVGRQTHACTVAASRELK